MAELIYYIGKIASHACARLNVDDVYGCVVVFFSLKVTDAPSIKHTFPLKTVECALMSASFWHSKSILAIVEQCSTSGSGAGGGSGMNTPGEVGHGEIGGTKSGSILPQWKGAWHLDRILVQVAFPFH